MSHFRAFIITKNKLRMITFAIIIILLLTVLLKFLPNDNVTLPKDDVIPVFSDKDAADIINKGVVSDDNSFEYNDAINKILGFDSRKPETILESSLGIQKKENKAKATSPPQPGLEKIPNDNHTLPGSEEISSAKGLKLNNATNYNVNLDQLCSNKLNIKLTKKEPEVLIIHTHTTECYIGDEMSGESERTTNEQYNMCAVGDIISETLQSYGIQAIHDKTIHDYPSYQGSYTRALETINKNISEYPSIKVVLDIHRDAYIYSDGTKLIVSTDIDGVETAQVMLVLGTDSMGLYHPNWEENLTLATKIQNAAEIMYPGLMRPINLRRERFNMHLTTGSLLLEIGSNGNSLNEAKLAAEYISKAIAAVLLSC